MQTIRHGLRKAHLSATVHRWPLRFRAALRAMQRCET
jgi:hypothetical protein